MEPPPINYSLATKMWSANLSNMGGRCAVFNFSCLNISQPKSKNERWGLNTRPKTIQTTSLGPIVFLKNTFHCLFLLTTVYHASVMSGWLPLTKRHTRHRPDNDGDTTTAKDDKLQKSSCGSFLFVFAGLLLLITNT